MDEWIFKIFPRYCFREFRIAYLLLFLGNLSIAENIKWLQRMRKITTFTESNVLAVSL